MEEPLKKLQELGTNFTGWDWGIVTAYLTGTVLIGLYARRYIRSMSDYVVAGRSLKSYIAIATMVGTELGLVTVMYSAQKGFTGGFAAFHIGLIAGIGTLIIGLTGFIVVPLRRMGVMTVPEFYQRRFGRGVRVFGGVLLAGAGILNMGMFLKAGGIFVTALTGLHDPMYVNVVMTVLIVLVLAYTILGGMVSVVITDYVQFIVLSFGMLLCCAFALQYLGWDGIVDGVTQVHGAAGFNPFDSEGFGLEYVMWMIFAAGLVGGAVWPTALMRACAVESTRVVKRLYVWSSIGFLIRNLLPNFLGICALVYMWDNVAGHDVFFTAKGEVVDDKILTLHAMPTFLGQILPAGLIGLVGAGMLAAFMSTHDSYLLCWSSVIVQDVIDPCMARPLSTRARLTMARVLIFVIGAFLLIWSLWYPLGVDLWDYMAVSGAIYFIGAFILLLTGLYWKWPSRVGAYLALGCGTLAVLGLAPVKKAVGLVKLEEYLAELAGVEKVTISSEHVGLVTTGLAMLLMVGGSLLFPDKKNDRQTDA
ncbi:MAG: sodium:solute symporter family protein [Planctomycetota bacterium]|jgi:SSS family solute:Na+ symporter